VSNVAHLDAARTLFATRETYNFETFFGATDDETLFELAQAARALGSVDVARELFRRACDAGCQRADAR
jgi:hypothetical protein